MLLESGIRNEYSSAINQFFENLVERTPVAIDLETKGSDPCQPDTWVVGCSIATENHAIYFHFGTDSEGQQLWKQTAFSLHLVGLRRNVRWIAHNWFFDGSWIARDLPDVEWKFYLCTYAALRWTATEGFIGQQWGLKWAQEHLLGWEETNEQELDEWLCINNYGRIVNEKVKDENGEVCINKETGQEETRRKLQPRKEEMWRAPAHILGKYCALDSYSTALLFGQVLNPALSRFNIFYQYIQLYQIYLPILIAQRFAGININTDKLKNHKDNLERRIEDSRQDFLRHPKIAPLVAKFNEQVIEEHRQKEPSQFKKQRERQEPARLKKNGEISKNWMKWKELQSAAPEMTVSWANWHGKLIDMQTTNHFNLDSVNDLRWLFYEQLGYQPTVLTDSGLPAVDEDALSQMGAEAKPLLEYKEATKGLTFVESLSALLVGEIYHPQVKVPGTLTGRLGGGGGFNIQNPPKDRGLLECFGPPTGYKLVQADFSALEMVVMAELSKDPALWKLYGPGAKQQDIYLFVGAHLPLIGPKIVAAGYDPENPTQEGIKNAKKVCKKERGIAKVVVLASGYGAGAGKIHQTLSLQGVSITKNECYQIHSAYWELFAGIKDWERELKRQWANNGGWVLNGIGRPLGVDSQSEKDLVNRVCQSTGHDCTILWIATYSKMLNEAGIDWQPWIADFHDESIVAVREDQAEAAKEILERASADALNLVLGGKIPLKLVGSITDNLADIKLED